jgi:glycosyltransferase involved in cell wall biosynthesis
LRVVHIISALYQGGAESQLEKLIYHSKSIGIEHIVVSLKNDETPLMVRLKENGVKVYCLGFNGVGSIVGFFKLVKLLKLLNSQECVFQCWMYHANFFGVLAGIRAGILSKIICNIRRTELPKGATGILAKISAKLSHIFPITTVCCAEAARLSHIKSGYNNEHMKVIFNGIDTKLFKPEQDIRELFRKKINAESDEFIIGMIGRYAPIKGHLNMLRAFQYLLQDIDITKKSVRLVLIGRGIRESKALHNTLNLAELEGKVTILDEQSEIWRVMAGLDLLCLPSNSEGFPNVVAEAMSSSVPAIVTDVGDAALIVNRSEMIVPPRNSHALAAAIKEYIQRTPNEKKALANDVRKLIVSRYSLGDAWNNYYTLYKNILES